MGVSVVSGGGSDMGPDTPREWQELVLELLGVSRSGTEPFLKEVEKAPIFLFFVPPPTHPSHLSLLIPRTRQGVPDHRLDPWSNLCRGVH